MRILALSLTFLVSGCTIAVTDSVQADLVRRVGLLEQAAQQSLARDQELVNGHNGQAKQIDELRKAR